MKNEQEQTPRQNVSETLAAEQQGFREYWTGLMKDAPQEGHDAHGKLVRIEAVNLTGGRRDEHSNVFLLIQSNCVRSCFGSSGYVFSTQASTHGRRF
jgi:hypothetical protein